MDLTEYRTLSHGTWERMAAGWDGWNQMLAQSSRPVTDDMVAALDPKAGETILELAAGAGVTGFAAASVMQGAGQLIMTDFASHMVEACERRGSELGFTNIDYRLMDAERIDLADDSVDGVLCRWGYMLMAEPSVALRETRRVLRDGGRLSFSVWGAPADNPFPSVPGRILVELGHMPPPKMGEPGMFALADPNRVEQLVRGAGFEALQLRQVRMSWAFNDFESLWTCLNEVTPLAFVIAKLGERELAIVRSEIKRALDPLGYDLPGICMNGLAR